MIKAAEKVSRIPQLIFRQIVFGLGSPRKCPGCEIENFATITLAGADFLNAQRFVFLPNISPRQ